MRKVLINKLKAKAKKLDVVEDWRRLVLFRILKI
jgi:hypothetical protein